MDTKESIKKKSSIIILIAAIMFVLFQGASVVLSTIPTIDIYDYDLAWIVESALMAIMAFALYFSYRFHAKNITKPLIGAALMLLLTYEITLGCNYLQYIKEVFAYVKDDISFFLFAISKIALLVVVFVINVLHYVINGSHHSRAGLVKANYVLCIIFAMLVAVEAVTVITLVNKAQLPLTDSQLLLYNLGDAFGALADIFALAIIVSIEVSTDEFRFNRDQIAVEETKE